jgi:hypothetical protein
MMMQRNTSSAREIPLFWQPFGNLGELFLALDALKDFAEPSILQVGNIDAVDLQDPFTCG